MPAGRLRRAVLWAAFPELRGKRWYASDLGPAVRSFALDTMSPLLPGSEQRVWFEHELDTLPKTVEFVLISLHHPPVADIQTRTRIDHNPRPNEIALRDYLKDAARTSAARLLVVSGHIHNYERFLQDDVLYLCRAAAGPCPTKWTARSPTCIRRASFRTITTFSSRSATYFPQGQMNRLDEASAPNPHFTVKDKFELHSRRGAARR